jgi:hypothetical protein
MDNLPAHPQAYATQSHPYQPAASGTPNNQGQDASTPRAFSWPATTSRLRRFTSMYIYASSRVLERHMLTMPTAKLRDFFWEHL